MYNVVEAGWRFLTGMGVHIVLWPSDMEVAIGLQKKPVIFHAGHTISTPSKHLMLEHMRGTASYRLYLQYLG